MFLLRIEICFSSISLVKRFLTFSSCTGISDTERSSTGNAHGKDTVKMGCMWRTWWAAVRQGLTMHPRLTSNLQPPNTLRSLAWWWLAFVGSQYSETLRTDIPEYICMTTVYMQNKKSTRSEQGKVITSRSVTYSQRNGLCHTSPSMQPVSMKEQP